MSSHTQRQDDRDDDEFFGRHIGGWVKELTHTPKEIPKPWYLAWMVWKKPDRIQVLIDPLPSAEELFATMTATLLFDKQALLKSQPERRSRVIQRIKNSLEYQRTSSL